MSNKLCTSFCPLQKKPLGSETATIVTSSVTYDVTGNSGCHWSLPSHQIVPNCLETEKYKSFQSKMDNYKTDTLTETPTAIQYVRCGAKSGLADQ